MLKITVPAAEFWDEIHEEFVYRKSRLCSWSIPWSLFQNGKVNGTRHFSENKKKPMRKFLIMYDA